MRKALSNCLIIAVFLAALALLPVVGYTQTVVFSDDFESEGASQTWNLSLWAENPGNVPNANSSLVNEGSNYGGASSSWSAQQLYPAGILDGGGTGWKKMGGSQLPSHFKVEFDFKLSSNFNFPLGHKWLRMFVDMNTGQGPEDVMLNNPMGYYGTNFAIEVYSNSTTFGSQEYVLNANLGAAVTRNVWHRIGYRFKKNTFTGSTPNADGEIEIFYDGVSIGSRTNVRITATASRWIRDFWGGPGNYTSSADNNPIRANQTIRVDNFKITDLTVPASVPTRPTGLTVQ